MAPRVLLLCILFTVGLLTGRSAGAAGLELSLGFARQPQDAVGVRSRPLTLECAVTSSLPQVNITWSHDGKLLQFGPADSRRVLLENGSLHFKRVLYKKAGSQDTSDQGEYRCIARNAVGALVSRPAQLRIAVLANSFTEYPGNMTVEAGDVVRFVCQIDSIPKAQISWERNGKPLPHNSRIITLDSGDLYLTDVQLTDKGTYRCIATNVANKKQRTSPEGVLTVVPRSPSSQPKPKFLPPLMPLVQTVEGDNLVLACAVAGPSVWELTWTRSSPSEQQVIVMNQTTNGVNILAVHNITLNHTGNYSCTAKTSGAQTITQVVRVDVWVPPTFKVNGTPVSEVYPPAKTVRFKCDAQGVPKPDIIWLKDGERLQINGRIKQRASELVLLNGVTVDSGLYQCVARNKAGENWAAGRLQVNASRYQPDPPKNLTCRTLSASQVVLSWDKSPKLDVMAYTVHYFLTDGGEERQKVAVNNTLLVDKLSPYTNYTFYVRAYNERSASDQSVRIVCQTGEGVPQGAPEIAVEATSPTTARVTWSPLPNEKARGVITEYKIQWRRSSHPSSNVDEVKGDVMEYTITGLHPGKMYEVRVLAATKKGWPDLNDDQLGWTLIQMPSYGPQNVPRAPLVNLTVINSSCIEVEWSLSPDNLYPPEGFKLFYRKQTSQQVGPIVLPANTTRYLLGGLDPNTWYEVHVLGFSEGDGEVGVQTVYTLPDAETLPSLPRLEPPSNLEAVPISPSAINLTWAPPSLLVNVAYYNVSYAPVIQREGNGSISYVRATGSGVEISHLKPYTLYEFKVRTHDHQNQFGPYSQKVECHTMEDVPGVVQDVQWKPINKTSIRVSWKEPAQTNGVISNYTVLYTQDASLPVAEWKQHRLPGGRSNTELVGLSSKGHYILSVRAATHAGQGPPSAPLMFTISASPGEQLNEVDSSGTPSDQHLGIVVGVIIGILCIIICSVVIICRRRFLQANMARANSNVQHANGNGYYREWDHSPINPQESELQELEFCGNVTATNIPPPNHNLDTKGGYPGSQANGLKHPLLSNGRIPNGHSARDRNSVHITENPQLHPSYKSRDMAVEKQKQWSSPTEESKLNGGESESPADHHLPLLGGTCEHSIVSSEEEPHDGDEPDAINCTQVTQLDLSFGSSNGAGTTVSQSQPPREQ